MVLPLVLAALASTAPSPHTTSRVVQEAADASSSLLRGSFSPAELGPREDDTEDGYAFALGLAMEGRFDAAAAALAKLAEDDASPLHERIATEARRIGLYQAERRRFLVHLQETGRKLNLRKSALKLLAPIEEVRESEVVLGKNRAKIDVLVLDDIDGTALAGAMAKSDFPASFISVYPLVLNGEGEDKAVLNEDSGDARSLRADAASGFDGHAPRASAARRLGVLSRVRLPVAAGEVETVLGELRGLAAEHGELDLVRERRDLLRRLGAEALRSRFDGEGLRGLLQGEVETLPDRRLRIRYGFDRPEELADFTDDGYLEKHAFLPRKTPEIVDKHLVGASFFCLRHRLAFEGPLAVRVTWRYRETAAWKYLFWLGLNDDGHGSFVAAKLDGGLLVVDEEKDSVRDVEGDYRWNFGETNVLEVRYDGDEKAYASMNGKAIKNVEVGPRRAGGVFLLACSRMFLDVEELVIEGTLDAGLFAKRRDSWMEKELAALGL